MDYAVIALAAASLVGVALVQGAVGAKEVATAIMALLGTFLGATFAFRLNQDKEDKKVQATRREAINRTMFVLARQANAVYQLKKLFEKYDNKVARAFNLSAHKTPSYTDLTHNFSDLEFFLESNDPTLLLHLAVEQERFQQVIESVKLRNEFYVNEFQPKLAESGLNGRDTTTAEAAALLGERLFEGIVNGTEIAYTHICASSQSIPEMQSKVLGLARTLFPGHKFVTYAKAA